MGVINWYRSRAQPTLSIIARKVGVGGNNVRRLSLNLISISPKTLDLTLLIAPERHHPSRRKNGTATSYRGPAIRVKLRKQKQR